MRLHALLLVAVSTNCASFDYPTTGVLGKDKFGYLCEGLDGGGQDSSDWWCDQNGNDTSIEVPSAVAKGTSFNIIVMDGTGLTSSDTNVIEPAYDGALFRYGTLFSARAVGTARISGSTAAGSDFVAITVVEVASIAAPPNLVVARGQGNDIVLTPLDAKHVQLAGRLYCDWETQNPKVAQVTGTTRVGFVRGIGEGSTKVMVDCGIGTAEIAIVVEPLVVDASADTSSDSAIDGSLDAPVDAPDAD